MTCKTTIKAGCAAAFAALFAHAAAFAQEAADAPQIDAELKAEVAYVEALVDCGFPDFAETVIAETKKKWPESEALFFAFEIRGMLSLGKFEEAEKKIAALPDRKSAKYWAARLEVANNYFARGKKDDCAKIYEEFFKNNQKPPKELAEFARNARYQWGQILLGMKRYKEAADTYVQLIGTLDKNNDDDENILLNVSSEAAEIYLRLAAEAQPKDRKQYLDPAKKLISDLLWHQDSPVYFGRAIAMKAHYELLAGSVAKAQGVIDDYIDQLAEIHQQIEKADPDGRLGLLKLSPMPQCRYLLADMLWHEAQEEFAKPKRDDERVKTLLFGAKKANGKRSGGGAYNHALTVFIKYPHSVWAAKAGDLEKEIASFAQDKFGAKIKSKVTDADMMRVKAMQFRAADELREEGKWREAIDEYYKALAQYPEGTLSIKAIEMLLECQLNLLIREKDAKAKEELRIEADAVEGYLSERFGGAKDKAVMSAAGDATLRIASKEKSYGEIARSDALQKAFIVNYRNHVNAANTAASKAAEAMKEKRWRDAIDLYGLVARHYKKSTYYAAALSSLATANEKLGDRAAAIDWLRQYIEAETKNPLANMQARMNLAMLYQKDGKEIIDNAETNATPEAVAAQLNKGSAQIVRGIKEFGEFAKAAAEKLSDEATPKKDKPAYEKMREASLYLVGASWTMMTKPESKIEAFRKRAIDGFEEYVKQYPKGQYAKQAYVRLGTMYTINGDMENSKNALARLRKEFPESEEAKKSMPRLAKNIIEYSKSILDESKREALKKEATDIYGEMIRSSGSDYQPYDFAAAGESLVEAKSWGLAEEAFDKAIQRAGTNALGVVARAYIGKAKSLFAQRNYAEAREALDRFFEDQNLSRYPIATNACNLLVTVASIQGKDEQDDKLRASHYGAAIGAIGKLRNYWKAEPQWKLNTLDLMSADVRIGRMEAETAMGKDEAAAKTRSTIAAILQSFVQAKRPSKEKPADKFLAEEWDVLEAAYGKLVPLLVKMGPEQATRARTLCEEYLKYFPNGASKATIERCLKEAIAQGGESSPDGADAAPEAAPEAEVPPSAPAAE